MSSDPNERDIDIKHDIRLTVYHPPQPNEFIAEIGELVKKFNDETVPLLNKHRKEINRDARDGRYGDSAATTIGCVFAALTTTSGFDHQGGGRFYVDTRKLVQVDTDKMRLIDKLLDSYLGKAVNA